MRGAIVNQMEVLRREREAVLKYFAESSSMTTETFFSIFQEFLGDFEVQSVLAEW